MCCPKCLCKSFAIQVGGCSTLASKNKESSFPKAGQLKADLTVELTWKWPENSPVAPLNHLPESLSPRDPKGATTYPNKVNKMKIYPTEQEKIFVEHIPDKE